MSTLSPLSSISAPLPDIEPLELFYVTDGSLLTAESWWQSHRYYQHRQNLHYQSLHQPGIVRGLGVRAIPAPDSVPSELRDSRWIEIQPGIAIDLLGNPIVVEQPISFRITAEVIDQPLTVYIALAYVDPQTKQWKGMPASVVKEDFRINECTAPPSPNEVELCRIALTGDTVAPGDTVVLDDAVDVFHPAPQEIDFRDRHPVQSRPRYPVQIGVLDTPSNASGGAPLKARLAALLQAAEGLYPMLASTAPIATVSLKGKSAVQRESRREIRGEIRGETPQTRRLGAIAPGQLPDMTLLVLPYTEAIALTEAEIERLQTYLARGSTLLIEYASDEATLSHLQALCAVQTELQAAIDDLQDAQPETELSNIRQNLQGEKRACEEAIEAQLADIRRPIEQWGQSEVSVETFSQSPFSFDALPHLPTRPIYLMVWEGIVLVVGSLSAAWMPQQFGQPLPRPTLRSAQELGLNILRQASGRQQMLQAQQPSPVGR